METVVEVSIPTEEFVLRETVDTVPDVAFEAVRFAVDGPDRTMPFLWASTDRLHELDARIPEDSTVDAATRLSDGDGRGLYAIDWTTQAERIIEPLVEAAGTVLEVHGTAEGWNLRILFPDRATASETYQGWCGDGVSPTLCCINSLSAEKQGARALSPTQQDVVLTAFRRNYYDVPRGTTLQELATNFEVSHQALSENLRRGHANLVERLVAESAPSAGRPP
jgi:predicted DNA binding protein